MEELKEKLKGLIESVEILNEKDITFDDLGTANGFHEAEKSKNEFCKYVTNIFTNVSKYFSQLNDTTISDSLDQAKAALDQINSFTQNIEKLVESGVHDPNFPSQRTKLTNHIKNQHINLKKQLTLLELNLELIDIKEKVGEGSFIESLKQEAEQKLLKIEETAKTAESTMNEATKILNLTQDKTISKGIESSASHFGELYKHHKSYELYWLIGLIVSSLALLVAIFYALSIEISEPITIATVINFTKRIILISLPPIFLKLALTKYNAERNLRIIYAHREKVLEQYKSFEAGIGEDQDAKNQFRLEVARYIFSDPKSNYGNAVSNTGSEININPVVAAVEKVIGSK